MKINAKITISRYHGHSTGIGIKITDEKSGVQFFDGEMTLEAYAECISGLSACPVSAEVRGLQHVGKKRIYEHRSVFCPLKTYDRAKLSAWIDENCQEDGWLVSSYLGSQNSIRGEGEGNRLNYSVTKYVDDEGKEAP